MAVLWLEDLVSFEEALFKQRASSPALRDFADKITTLIREDYGSFKITQEEVDQIGAHIFSAEKMGSQAHLDQTLGHMLESFKAKANLKSPISEAAINEFNKEAEEARKASEDKIRDLEKEHPHFSKNVIENFRESTVVERGVRGGLVTIGAVLLGKSFTWDRHQDQEGHKPPAAIKIIDGTAGAALLLGALCIRPRKGGPQAEIIDKVRGRVNKLEQAMERGV